MSSTKNRRPVTERRIIPMTNCEVRAAAGDEPAVFSGYAAVFNELSVNLGGFRERIQPGCFRNAVDQGQDVRFLINHDANLMLGRTKSGTVTLTEDEIGLRVECTLPETSYAVDLAESMRRKDIDQMSFGFTTREDAWDAKDAESGLPIRELIEADLFDVSVVAYPAYPDTSAEVRSMIEEHNPELLKRAARAAAELAADEAKPGKPGRAHRETERHDDDVVEPETETVEKTYEQLRGEAGVRVEEGHPQCDGVAVVWNFNDELQSCHLTREAADAQLEALMSGAAGAAREDGKTVVVHQHHERVGKTLSQKNAEAITAAAEMLQTVLTEAGAFEPEPAVVLEEVHTAPEGEDDAKEIALPDLAALRAQVEERGWNYDDDWSIWNLTQMIECASMFLLYADDQNDDDAAADQPLADGMKAILAQLSTLLTQVVAEGSRGLPPEPPAPDEPAEEPGRHDMARRRLSLQERELFLVAT